jgi:hypothetical protein
MEVALAILILIAVIAIALVVFTAWVFVSVLKALVRTVVTPFKKAKPAALPPPPVRRPQLQDVASSVFDEPARCPRDNCRQINPAAAQFCRRCGMNLVAIKAYGPTKARRELVA